MEAPVALAHRYECGKGEKVDEVDGGERPQEGTVGFFPVCQPAAASGAGILPLCAHLSGGHTDIVRAVEWRADAGWGNLISGGEDARLCVWSSEPNVAEAAAPIAASAVEPMSLGDRPSKRTAPRYSPY